MADPRDSVFHAGEQAVQDRAGVGTMARRVGAGIHAFIPEAARTFLERQAFAVVSSTDDSGRVWGSLVWGAPGFLQVENDRTLRVDSTPLPADPLGEALSRASENPVKLGLLAIEFSTRRRMRLNGRAEALPGGGFRIHADQVYANCPKYIQKRETEIPQMVSAVSETITGEVLSTGQQDWIKRADTFFIASASAEGDADASHRGGNPGFVEVRNERTLIWPDYSGNAMFNTLGNIAVNPRVGLLFLNFETGSILQLTGTAKIHWGHERAVVFTIERVREIERGFPLLFPFVEFSPFNPD